MNYLEYTSEEFALDTSFINYVKGTVPSDIAFWKQWISENPSHGQIIADATTIVKNVKFDSHPISKDKEDAIWNTIAAKTNPNINSKTLTLDTEKRGRRAYLPWLSIAAAACLGILVFFSIGTSSDLQIQTDLAQFENHQLPDGSIVELNAASSIQYNRKSFETNRRLKLSGEGFFTVAEGASFTVETDHGTVQVLGTEFNVYARAKQFNVSCTSGKVQVSVNDMNEILTASETILFEEGIKVSENKEDIQKRDTWRTGVYHYVDASLREISADIERHFGKTVTMNSEIANRRFSGSFTCQNVETALSEVCWPLNLTFDIFKNEIQISE